MESAAAFTYLNLHQLAASPLPMGRGFINTQHGVLPLPAPVTVECLKGLITYEDPLDFEFVTPTGAAIIAGPRSSLKLLADSDSRAHRRGRRHSKPKRKAQPAEGDHRVTPDHIASSWHPSHIVLEANIDDATGELLGHCIDSLLQAGALDAWVTPLVMKKGRPCF
ncbi:hypothetical protein BCY86_02840 [Pajaroellobacter abortibovis]|uniref:Uncharacterized protein n=1 Tax=Pajaroellobacter abortibovis TaxID=1882918 RepID=A0A1L6MWC0_9BACT|nr:hypothetical protein BCY86_02840 [Pajaroellobacter abortibovis]